MRNYLIYKKGGSQVAIKFVSEESLDIFIANYHGIIKQGMGGHMDFVDTLQSDSSLGAEAVYFADLIEDRRVLAMKIVNFFM